MNHFLKKEKLPTILCADRFYMTDKGMLALKSAGRVVWADSKSEDELIKTVCTTKAQVIVSEYFEVTGRVLDASRHLKGVVVWGVGYDHVDVEAASERGIYVANTRGSNTESVAEHTFALIFALSRRLLLADAFVRGGRWVDREEAALPHNLIESDLYGKILGIVGLGSIGSRVARIAHVFNMHVLAYDPYINLNVAREKGTELVDLKTLLKESDFITVHVVLTKETRDMISIEELDLMKPTAYLINTSRGPVINEEALIMALKEKKIAGAGLDVFRSEPIHLDNPLLRFDNLIVTPHCAGNSEEALKATSLMVSEEVVRILSNQPPKNLVNRSQLIEKGYLKQLLSS